MTKIYFVRHAQPVHSDMDDRNRPLTAEGRRDTALVLDTLRDKAIDCFYCSPYRRSLDTIQSAADFYGLPIHTDERLREREAGDAGNLKDLFRRRWADHSFHEPGGESLEMVQTRNITALREILARHPDERVAIGTHGTALSTILNYYDPDFGCEDFLRIIDWMPYIIELDFDGERLVGMREIAHIYKEFKG